MSDAKRKMYMVISAIAIAYWGFNNFQGKDEMIPPANNPVQIQQQIVAAQEALNVDLTLIKNKSWGKDPFNYGSQRNTDRTHNSSTVTKTTDFKLKAIIYNKTSPSAFLNGRIVRKGDIVDGAQVISISKNAVILSANGQEITVRIERG